MTPFDFSTLATKGEAPPQAPTAMLTTRVTSYSVVDGKIVENIEFEEAEVELREGHDGEIWLHFCRGYESLPLSGALEVLAGDGRPWAANFGRKPLFHPACTHPNLSHECCGRTCEIPTDRWTPGQARIDVLPEALCNALADLLVATS